MSATGDVSGCDGAQKTLVVVGVVNTLEFADVGVQIYF
jgi:hypothetical protein